MNVPDGYEYYENKNRGCLVNVIYRLAEVGGWLVVGLVVGGVVMVMVGSLVQSVLASGLIAKAANALTALLYYGFIFGGPVLLMAFAAARYREWRAERDYQRSYNVTRLIAREQAREFSLFTFGDPDLPHALRDDDEV